MTGAGQLCIFLCVVMERGIRQRGPFATIARRITAAKLVAAAVCADSTAVIDRIRRDAAERRRRLRLSKHEEPPNF